METKCAHCPLRRSDAFIPFSQEDERFMQRFKSGEMTIDPGSPVMMEGSNSPQLFTALRGMGVRYKTLEDGRRQVINFVFPGDFLGLQAGVLGEMKHSVEATTHMTLCMFDRTEFWGFFKNHPERAFDITWLAAVEEHFLGATLVSIGQRDAIERIAWALLRVFEHGRGLGLVKNGRMPFPFRQQDLADALGLSLVHTNKTLAKLRDRQVVSWTDGVLQINDPETMASIAVTDTSEAEPRPLM